MIPESTSLNEKIKCWEKELNSFQADPAYIHDPHGLAVCKLALAAVRAGNFGIGCIILNEKGEVVAEGKNMVFQPSFRSDLHSEMVALNNLEKKETAPSHHKGYTAFSSLEPCPMCFSRLVISGISHVYYLAEDREGGMVQHKHHMPPIWQKLMEGQNFQRAQCSKKLLHIANEIVHINSKALNKKLMERR